MSKRSMGMILAATTIVTASLAKAGAVDFVQGESNEFVTSDGFDYAGTSDASVYANTNAPNYNYNYGGANKLITRNSSSRYRFIMDFDLSSLNGLGLTVQSATLVLTKFAASISTSDTTLYTYTVASIAPTNAGWNQGTDQGASVQTGEVTGEYWAEPDPSGTPAGVLWQTTAGAQSPVTSGVAGAGVTTNMFTSQGYTYNADPNGTAYALSDPSLTSLVQSWIDSPSQNAGLFFSNGGASIEVEFASSEYVTPSWRPDLQLTLSSPTMSTNWNVDSDGAWSGSSNWDNGTPNSVGAIANFGNTISAPRTITVDAPQIVSTINFDSPEGYTIAGSDAIRLLEVNVGQATINVASGSQTISAPIILSTSTTVTTASDAALALMGGISGPGTLTNAGPGPLTIGPATIGGLNASGGTFTITGAASISGAASINTTSMLDVDADTTVGQLQGDGTGTLNIAGAALAATAQGGAAFSVAGLSITGGGKLDISNGSLIINYTPGNSPLSTIKGYIHSAYDNGAWDGPGLTSSATTVAGTALGYVDTGAQVEVMYTWYGDLDLSGSVDSTDLNLMGVIPTTGPEAGLIGWFDGDLNYDGLINADDWALFQFGLAESGGASITSVPEPAVLSLLAVGGIALSRRSTLLTRAKRRQ